MKLILFSYHILATISCGLASQIYKAKKET